MQCILILFSHQRKFYNIKHVFIYTKILFLHYINIIYGNKIKQRTHSVRPYNSQFKNFTTQFSTLNSHFSILIFQFSTLERGRG